MNLVLRQDDLWEMRSFALRRMFDLQFESIWLLLRAYLQQLPPTGVAVDMGAGRSPFRTKFPPAWKYVTVDPFSPADYAHLSDLPPGLDADLVLMTEVLEHVPDPDAALKDVHRHTKPDGRLLITVPFNARVHGAPNDFRRWTPSGLEQLMAPAGWTIERLEPRGSDITTLAAKLIFLCARRLTRPVTAIPAALSLVVFGLPLLLLAQACLRLDLGAKDDPLGFFVIAKKA
jgi:SAM-dependent methyltransferase